MEEFENNFLDKVIKEIHQNVDNTFVTFLNNNGYKIDKPLTQEKLQPIQEHLKDKGLYLDSIEYLKFDDKSFDENKGKYVVKAVQYIIPFFNNLKNPINEQEKLEIMRNYFAKENNNE